jgi:hypothetical protein
MAAEKSLSQVYLATQKLLAAKRHGASIIAACVQLSEESPMVGFGATHHLSLIPLAAWFEKP